MILNPEEDSTILRITVLVDEAKKILKETPYDVAHDLFHHERVWNNVQRITRELDDQVDLRVLQVSSFWHDVTLGKKSDEEDRSVHVGETLDHLQKLMTENGFDKLFQKKVLNTIKEHEFTTKKQTTIEAQILFDADKLDAFHKDRYSALLFAYKEKQFSKIKLALIVQAAKLWLKKVPSRYHFDISREIHEERIELLLEDSKAVQEALSLGIDIVKLVK